MTRKNLLIRLAATAQALILLGMTPAAASADVPPTGSDPPGGRFERFTEEFGGLVCSDCGKNEPFWIFATPEPPEGESAQSGIHWKMTMCLNCGTLNGDLPAEDEGFGQNVLRREECGAETVRETVRYEAEDGEYHLKITERTVRCPACGETREAAETLREEHRYAVRPSGDTAGGIRFVCTCGDVRECGTAEAAAPDEPEPEPESPEPEPESPESEPESPESEPESEPDGEREPRRIVRNEYVNLTVNVVGCAGPSEAERLLRALTRCAGTLRLFLLGPVGGGLIPAVLRIVRFFLG